MKQGEIDFDKPASDHKCEYDFQKVQEEIKMRSYREFMKKIEEIKKPVVCPDCGRERTPKIEIIFLWQSGFHWLFCGCGNETHWQTDLEGKWIDTEECKIKSGLLVGNLG